MMKNYRQPVFRIIGFEDNDVVTSSSVTVKDNVAGALGVWGDEWKGTEVL
ncbi:MAG: hypothetical protein SPH68_01165 [Candidatus Borkfalkiaceae bacterium]|nr:hypothetical protein [Clostridia bacterium]MDY6222754.1 hypothetical protein [Christensenellaceae bacterium]